VPAAREILPVAMKRPIQIIAMGALIALVPSCTTSRQEAQEQLATASAMMVALPMIPVAIPITAVRELDEKRAEKKLQDVLDPVYENRIRLIQERDPIADAREAWLSGARAFLPSLPHGNTFPGLENTEFNLKKGFGSENYGRLQQNEFLCYLETLMENDPVQVQNRNIQYFSGTFKLFIHVSWKYREAFNKEIYSRQMSSN
jgi:hypothetical protein